MVRASSEPRVAAWVKTDPAGVLRPVGSGPLPAHLPGAAWVWVDVTAASPEIALELGARFRLPDHVVEDAVDVGVFPKWEDHGDRLLAVLHLPIPDDDDQIDTMPVVCLVGADLLITFHPAPHPGLEWLLDAVGQHAVLADGGPDRMLGRLADFGAREFAPLVEGCDVAFDALADRALQGDPAVLSDTQALRRDAALLRSVLGPQREIIHSLALADAPLLDGDARRRLRDAYDRHHRLVEELDVARIMLASVADTYRAAVAERTNDVMKVLTVFSATLLPLSVIAGIYGMNFERMPELRRPWAYPAVLAVMAAIVAGLWGYFVRRGFIGGPRISGVSRRVGRGLVGVTRAPVGRWGTWCCGRRRRRRRRQARAAPRPTSTGRPSRSWPICSGSAGTPPAPSSAPQTQPPPRPRARPTAGPPDERDPVSETWIRALASVAGGFVVGALLSWLVRRVLRSVGRRPELAEIAAPVAAFLFWLAVTAGIVLAVAVVEPQTIENLPADVLSYLPRVLAAGLILLAGRALGVATAAAAGRALARALGRPSGQAVAGVRLGVNLAAAVLALSQLGVETTVLVVLAAGVAVSLGLSFALLVGLGGRDAAREIAAGRYLRRFVAPGSTLRSPVAAGSVVALHPLTTELVTDEGRRLHVPHSRLLGDILEVDGRDGGEVGEGGEVGVAEPGQPRSAPST